MSAAAGLACRRAGPVLGLRSGSGWAALAGGVPDGVARHPLSLASTTFHHPSSRGDVHLRHISQLAKINSKGACIVDTLALVRNMEAQGIPTKHAEAITLAITRVVHDNLDNVVQSVVSKEEMQKSEVIQESSISKFKSEVKSSQEHHFSMLQHETEKLKGDIDKMRSDLKGDMEKMRSDLRHEIDKVTAGQRLDLNLERGRIRDELAKQNSETTDLTTKLDREIHALRAHLEAAKYEVIKYCIGSLVSISAVGLAVVRILM